MSAGAGGTLGLDPNMSVDASLGAATVDAPGGAGYGSGATSSFIQREMLRRMLQDGLDGTVAHLQLLSDQVWAENEKNKCN